MVDKMALKLVDWKAALMVDMMVDMMVEQMVEWKVVMKARTMVD
jgi:hypothetical protein